MKGSLTVEASFVLPLCFLFVGLILYLGLYQYNEAVLRMTGYECILQTVERLGESELEFRECLIQNAENAAKVRTLGTDRIEVTVKTTPARILMTYRCRQAVFLETDMEVTVFYDRIYPERTLRLETI